MEQEEGRGMQTGRLLADPTQASSAAHTEAPTIRYSSEMAKENFSFLRIIFCGRNGMGSFWFIKKIFPQLVVGILLNLAVDLSDLRNTGWWASRADTQRLHAFVGAVLAFVLVFRSNASYDRYYEARKTLGVIANQCREAVLESCSVFIIKDEGEHNNLYRNEIRRKFMVMMAFIRQNIRESHVGFMPNSSESETPFHEGTNYIRDPTRPRLCDLLTLSEVEDYVTVLPPARAACVASEIKGIAQLLARNVEFSILYYSKVSQCLQLSLDAQETLYRIVTTPVPYPYSWVLNVMLVVFIYSVPFLYESQRGGSYFGTIILVVAYFGCQRIAQQCENPLEWDACDLDIELLTMYNHDETRDISNFTHSLNKGFIPSSIRHAPTEPAPVPVPDLADSPSLAPEAEATTPTKPPPPG
jgi:putative membrane protein